MQVTSFSYSTLHLHGDLLPNFFRARYDAFITKRGWDLPNVDGMEFDQYDTPATTWIAAHQGSHIRAGVRLTPTTHRCGTYTYMIKDAQDGKLDSLPTDILYDPAPVSDNVWEASRIFISDDQSVKERIAAQYAITRAMVETGAARGADELLAITPGTWPRFYPRFGLDAYAVGRVMNMEDGDFQTVAIRTKKDDPF